MVSNKCLKMNNRGLSLVELIVAISIGVIIAGSITALMSFAIRVFRNESVNASTQYELQTNINMLMDVIMQSSAVVVVQNGGGESEEEESEGDEPEGEGHLSVRAQTKYAMFGNPNASIIVEDVAKKGFKGVIFVPSNSDGDGRFKIYMKEVEAEITETSTLDSIASDQYTDYFGEFETAGHDPNDDEDLLQYLLGENATGFEITVDPNGGTEGRCLKKKIKEKPDAGDPDTWIYEYYYVNPIEVGVKLKFEKDGWAGRKYEKQVDDVAYMRNKVQETIYVDGQAYEPEMKED